MRVLVVGANGQIGHQVAEKLKEKGHEPVAMVRREEQVGQFKDKGIETVLADLEKDFSHAFENVDAVVFAAGSGGSTGADKTIIIDQEGAIETVDNAREAGVKHFAIVSSIGAGDPKNADQIKHYMYAKHRADEHLKASGLDYTIIRPRSEEHTSELQSRFDLVCRLLLEKKNKTTEHRHTPDTEQQ